MLSNDDLPSAERPDVDPDDHLLYLLGENPRLLEAFLDPLSLDADLLERPAFRRLIARFLLIGGGPETWGGATGVLPDPPWTSFNRRDLEVHARLWRMARTPNQPDPPTVALVRRYTHGQQLWDDLCQTWLEISGQRLRRRERLQLQPPSPLARAFLLSVCQVLLTLGYIPDTR